MNRSKMKQNGFFSIPIWYNNNIAMCYKNNPCCFVFICSLFGCFTLIGDANHSEVFSDKNWWPTNLKLISKVKRNSLRSFWVIFDWNYPNICLKIFFFFLWNNFEISWKLRFYQKLLLEPFAHCVVITEIFANVKFVPIQ